LDRQTEGLRRVTNAPACAALASFPKGTVTGGVQNLTGGGPFFVYVQGAPGVQMATVAPGSTTMVTFNDVADLGSDVQIAVVMEGLNHWIAPIAAADVQPGQTIVFDRAAEQYGFEGDLWLMDQDGMNPRLLVEDAIVPTWGPGVPVLDEWLYLPMMTR
jgi:hypothetical protein